MPSFFRPLLNNPTNIRRVLSGIAPKSKALIDLEQRNKFLEAQLKAQQQHIDIQNNFKQSFSDKIESIEQSIGLKWRYDLSTHAAPIELRLDRIAEQLKAAEQKKKFEASPSTRSNEEKWF